VKVTPTQWINPIVKEVSAYYCIYIYFAKIYHYIDLYHPCIQIFKFANTSFFIIYNYKSFYFVACKSKISE
jgi:hypothetical protein